MIKRTLEIAAALLLVLSLCACGYGRRIGERAIVKTIYLDQTQAGVQAGLIVFTCEPNTDTAAVRETAKLYTGVGRNVEEALSNAQQQQNKKMFYAQNELLFLGPGTLGDISPYLRFFTEENAARPNLTVFLTPYHMGELAECAQTFSKIVYEAERTAADPRGQGSTGRIFEWDTGGLGMSGALPIYTFSKEESDYFGVKQLMLFQQGTPAGKIEKEHMQLYLLLNDKAHSLEINTEIQGDLVSFRTHRLYISRTAKMLEGVPYLEVRIAGKLAGAMINGKPVKKEQSGAAAARINSYLSETAQQMNDRMFGQEMDLFGSRHWMRMQDRACCDALEAQGKFYETARVVFHFSLLPA